ncbi:multisubunit Na+/H+ antiporter MnhG subunit [Microbacterium sp. 1154]|uniref:hypothetical protein n=1 Tax=Microbacterium sp. 1154 TaxID=2817733 RepID=UPI002865C045|nr:hypothetical protein [Microbacterium sp. 1154]MDR6692526.1 multisubunit Na+/H+ antiporter MnhG subunit [Microbacterium sp. 1154]
MSTLGTVITVAGCVVLLAGIVALYRALRNDDDVRRARAFSVAVGIMSMGVIVGAVGIGVGTGDFPSGAVFVAVAGLAVAGAVLRYSVREAEKRQREGDSQP